MPKGRAGHMGNAGVTSAVVPADKGPGPGSQILPRRGAREHEVHLAATEVFRASGVCAYHTSVHVGGREFFFDISGISSGPSLHSHTGGRAPGPKTEVCDLGFTCIDGATLVKAMSPIFSKGSYDILRKNCNTFTDAAVFLLTGKRLDAHYARPERFLLATEPVSMLLVRQILAARCLMLGDAGGAMSAIKDYTCNPFAEGFSVDRIIAGYLSNLRYGPQETGGSNRQLRDPQQSQKASTQKRRKERESCRCELW